MNDRELLEAAAKAVGMVLRYNYLGGRDANQQWDPLEDDGDALRLAVALRLEVDCENDPICAGIGEIGALEWHNSDPCAATRRAIVRAAAQIAGAQP